MRDGATSHSLKSPLATNRRRLRCRKGNGHANNSGRSCQRQRLKPGVPRPPRSSLLASSVSFSTLLVHNDRRARAEPASGPSPPMTEPSTPAEHPERSEAQLLDHIASSRDGIHLEGALRGRYSEDAFFAPVVKNPHQYKNFRISDGLVFLRERGRELLCVPHIIVNGRSAREIVISHAHSLLAHLGPRKTADLLRDHVWWKT
ncbi:hypothetical protein BD311DRAFT_611463, partial [Dichomitus squalens]